MSDLRTELLAIRAKRGVLTPRVVMEEAMDFDHPLHDRIFDVPPDEAAERYYLSNAAKLLRVTFRADLGGRPADLRAFWVQRGTPEDPQSQYVPIEEIAADPMSQRLMLQQMRRDWQRFRNRYENHEAFLAVINENWPDDWPRLGGDPDSPSNGTEG